MQTVDLSFLVSSYNHGEFKHFSFFIFLSRSSSLVFASTWSVLVLDLVLSWTRYLFVLAVFCLRRRLGGLETTNSLDQNSSATQNLVTEKQEDEFLQPRRKLVANHSRENPLRCGWRPWFFVDMHLCWVTKPCKCSCETRHDSKVSCLSGQKENKNEAKCQNFHLFRCEATSPNSHKGPLTHLTKWDKLPLV